MNQLVESGSIGDGRLQQTDTFLRSRASSALGTLGLHWPEYLMEAGELGLYMFFACVFATLLQHPSPVRQFIGSSLARRARYGLAIGSTVIGIVTTLWGKQSGGHFNPAITFTFYRLGKVGLWDGSTLQHNFPARLAASRSPRMCCEERRRMLRYGTPSRCPACTAMSVHSSAN